MKRLWFYRPRWYIGTWKPVWFGNDEAGNRTLVIGWAFTGQAVLRISSRYVRPGSADAPLSTVDGEQ